MPATFHISRRRLLQATGALALAAGLPTPAPRRRADQGRRDLHRAGRAAVGQPHPQGRRGRRRPRGEIDYVFTENTSNTDYERVMREYAEAGNKLIVGEVFGVEQAARTVAPDYPGDRLPHGLEPAARPGGAELLGLRQLHPGRELSHRNHCRRDDASPARSASSAASRSRRSTG